MLPGSNGSGRLIAERLARAGIASVRYDKRGIGVHGKEQLPALLGKVSMAGFAEEFAGAVRVAADQEFIRDDRIFALGNSEGTLHALNYQLGKPAIPLRGLVLVSPPGRAVGAVARWQLAAQAATVPGGDAMMALYDAAVARFQAGAPAVPDPALPEGIRQLVASLETPFNLPFTRELWVADESELLGQVDAPVLIVIGDKDVQVDRVADGGPLQRAAEGHPNVSFLFPENMNHVLKQELRPRAELTPEAVAVSYSSPDTILDPEAVAGILAWLDDRSRVGLSRRSRSV
ncbi:alpha/beta hydrolase [Nocardia sp. NBC_01388]|uniref:alpha/beta hydrolase n=1 Tax=Nocardia sp. NBC_01388 TaxID=2903596 RepID=UPI0032537F6D